MQKREPQPQADKWQPEVGRLQELLADEEQQVCRAAKRQMQTVTEGETSALLSRTGKRSREQSQAEAAAP